MTERSAFVLRVCPERLEEYVRAHEAVWPDMLDAIRAAGIRNYTIFRDGDRMFGYFEADDLAAAGRYLAEQEVSARWQDARGDPRLPLVPSPDLDGKEGQGSSALEGFD